MPPVPPPTDVNEQTDVSLPKYPPLTQLGSSRLNIVLFPLDTTENHPIMRWQYLKEIDELRIKGSPLAEWHAAIMASVFKKMEKLHIGHDAETTSVVLHDPLCIWWTLDASRREFPDAKAGQGLEGNSSGWKLSQPLDIRVETTGQWSRGACIVDKRDRKQEIETRAEAEKLGDRIGDAGVWLSDKRGNRIRVCNETPGKEAFAKVLLRTIFGTPLES